MMSNIIFDILQKLKHIIMIIVSSIFIGYLFSVEINCSGCSMKSSMQQHSQMSLENMVF